MIILLFDPFITLQSIDQISTEKISVPTEKTYFFPKNKPGLTDHSKPCETTQNWQLWNEGVLNPYIQAPTLDLQITVKAKVCSHWSRSWPLLPFWVVFQGTHGKKYKDRKIQYIFSLVLQIPLLLQLEKIIAENISIWKITNRFIKISN